MTSSTRCRSRKLTDVQVLATLSLPGTVHAQTAQEPPAQFIVKGGDCHLYTRMFRSQDVTYKPVLVVILHGDAPHSNPGYQYGVATQIAATCPDVVVAALLRPG